MRFLRLFLRFRALEAELADTAFRGTVAEDRERMWRVRCEAAEEQRDKALQSTERNHKMIENYLAICAGAPHVPNPDVYVPMPRAENENPDTPEPRRRQARDVVRDAELGFLREYGGMIDREQAQ